MFVKSRTLLLCLLATALSATPLCAQSKLEKITPNVSDQDAARNSTRTHHALPANTTRGKSFRPSRTAAQMQFMSAHAASAHANSSAAPTVYPGTLSFLGGATVRRAESHAVFVNSSTACPAPACWGNPLQFLKDYGHSEFVRIVDQYVDDHRPDRYTLGDSFTLSAPSSGPYTDANMAAFAHAVASFGGFSGYDHIIHLFLPPGQDVCFDSSFTTCYSPDNPSSFAFCAYHSSADFTDVGHVLYTVEPFQDVPGCAVNPGTPNGQLVDSTNNILSHETTETITDPDGDAWINIIDLSMLFEETGDECELVNVFQGGFMPVDVELDHHLYAIQPEYSNLARGCASRP